MDATGTMHKVLLILPKEVIRAASGHFHSALCHKELRQQRKQCCSIFQYTVLYEITKQAEYCNEFIRSQAVLCK